MLGKLIKYEFKATYRFMLMIYSLLFVSGIILALGILFYGLFMQLEISGTIITVGETIISILGVVFISLFVMGTIFVLSVMTFYSIKRFHDNLLGDGGYLMHTLPVKTRDNIWAKCIVSVLWTVISTIAVIVVYYVLALILGGTETVSATIELFSEIDWSFFAELENVILTIEFILSSVFYLVNFYFCIYASIAIGYSLNNNRVLISVLSYIGFCIAESILSAAVSVPFLFWEDTYLPVLNEGIVIILHLIRFAVYYFITNYFMKNKLNLQ